MSYIFLIAVYKYIILNTSCEFWFYLTEMRGKKRKRSTYAFSFYYTGRIFFFFPSFTHYLYASVCIILYFHRWPTFYFFVWIVEFDWRTNGLKSRIPFVPSVFIIFHTWNVEFQRTIRCFVFFTQCLF